MFSWLNSRSASYRRAARPAAPVPVTPRKPEPRVDEIDDELPPPFFADADSAFLDMGDECPPPLPEMESSADAEERLERALEALPPFPEMGAADRTDRLLEI